MTGEVNSRDPAEGNELIALLRGELAAVHAYQRALRSAEGRATVDAAEILRFASEHQRTVAALQGAVREAGGTPAISAEPSGAFSHLRDTATVSELLSGEELTLQLYETAIEGLEGNARDLVAMELIPRQRKHIAELSAILSRLTS